MRTVVIVGRPNVGKSTLFNRLLGKRKALVHDQPGLTRDRNAALVEREGLTIQIVDTGGVLGESEDRLATLVEEQVTVAIAGGDLVLQVVDAKAGLTPLDAELSRRLITSGKETILVVNKVDVERHEALAVDFYALGLDPVLPVSAEHGGGMEALWEVITRGMEPREDEGEGDEEPAGEGPIRIAIVGRPNVGKSSILNRLMGESRSLVSEIPGTTRDPVDSLLSWQNRDIVLVDTAGIRRKSRTGRGAEILSVILARRSLQNCHLALLVVDASHPLSHQDAHIAGLVEGARKAAVLVLNKWDLVPGAARAKEVEQEALERLAFLPWMTRLKISAKTKRRVDRILPAAVETYGRYTQKLPTAKLNETLAAIVSRVPPPSIQGKQLKLRYVTQTGAGPMILTLFTNSRFPPPLSYSRYLKNRLREVYDLEGCPLILKFRKE